MAFLFAYQARQMRAMQSNWCIIQRERKREQNSRKKEQEGRMVVRRTRFGFRTRRWTARRGTQQGWTSWSISRPTSRIHPRQFEVIKLSSSSPLLSPSFMNGGRSTRPGCSRLNEKGGRSRSGTTSKLETTPPGFEGQSGGNNNRVN